MRCSDGVYCGRGLRLMWILNWLVLASVDRLGWICKLLILALALVLGTVDLMFASLEINED